MQAQCVTGFRPGKYYLLDCVYTYGGAVYASINYNRRVNAAFYYGACIYLFFSFLKFAQIYNGRSTEVVI